MKSFKRKPFIFEEPCHRNYRGVDDIACERDFSVFRSHTYKTVFEPFNFFFKVRIKFYRKLSGRL